MVKNRAKQLWNGEKTLFRSMFRYLSFRSGPDLKTFWSGPSGPVRSPNFKYMEMIPIKFSTTLFFRPDTLNFFVFFILHLCGQSSEFFWSSTVRGSKVFLPKTIMFNCMESKRIFLTSSILSISKWSLSTSVKLLFFVPTSSYRLP